MSQLLVVATALVLLLLGEDDPVLWLLAYGLSSCLPIACWSLIAGRGRGTQEVAAGTEESIKSLGYHLTPAAVADLILLRLDRLLLPVFGSLAGLGLYVVAATFSELSSILIRQYVDARVPKWRKQFDDGLLRPSRLLGVLVMISAVVSVLVGVGSYLSIPVLFGSEYIASLTLVPILSAAGALYGTSRLGVALAGVVGLPRWASAINGVGAIVGATAYLAMIPKYGPIGAAFGSLISYGACAIVTAIFCLRVVAPRES